MRRALLAIVAAAYLWSAVQPRAYGTWFFETVWIPVGVAVVLVAARRRYRHPPTVLLCAVLTAHALVLAYGGHYTYALTPLGESVRDAAGRVPGRRRQPRFPWHARRSLGHPVGHVPRAGRGGARGAPAAPPTRPGTPYHTVIRRAAPSARPRPPYGVINCGSVCPGAAPPITSQLAPPDSAVPAPNDGGPEA